MQLSHRVSRTRRMAVDLRAEMAAARRGSCGAILRLLVVVLLAAWLMVLAQALRLRQEDQGLVVLGIWSTPGIMISTAMQRHVKE